MAEIKNKLIQIKRNQTAFASLDLAKQGLIAQLTGANYHDGELILARYNATVDGDTVVRTLMGVAGLGAGNYTIFEGNDSTNEAFMNALEALKGTTYDENGDYATIADIQEALATLNDADTVDGSVAKQIKDAINELGYTVSTSNAAEVLTGFEIENGTLKSTTFKTIESGDNTVNVDATETGKIKVAVDTNKIHSVTGGNGITVTTSENAEDTIEVKLDGSTLAVGTNGLKANLEIEAITSGLPANVQKRYRLQAVTEGAGTALGADIDIPKDSSIVSIDYIGAENDHTVAFYTDDTQATEAEDTATQVLRYTYLDADGKKQSTDVDMASLILESEVERGLTVSNGKIGINISQSETLTVSGTATANAVTVNGSSLQVNNNKIQEAINYAANNALESAKADAKAKIEALDLTQVGTEGEYIKLVSQADGKVSATAQEFDTIIDESASNNNAPTTKAVKDYVDDSVDNAPYATTVNGKSATASNHAVTISGADINVSGAELTAGTADSVVYSDTISAAFAKVNASITSVNNQLSGLTQGNGITITQNGNTRTFAVKIKANDPILEVTTDGVAVKEDATFDCGTY